MDHDTYSANDAIGKVYLDLNPLLLPASPAPVKSSWNSENTTTSSASLTGGKQSGQFEILGCHSNVDEGSCLLACYMC